MNVHKVALAYISTAAIFVGGAVAADYAGDAIGSIWFSAGVGIIVVTAWYSVTARFWRLAREAGYLEKLPEGPPSDRWKLFRWLFYPAFGGFVAYLLFDASHGDFDGQPDHLKAYMAGIWGAALFSWIIREFQFNIPDSTS